MLKFFQSNIVIVYSRDFLVISGGDKWDIKVLRTGLKLKGHERGS